MLGQKQSDPIIPICYLQILKLKIYEYFLKRWKCLGIDSESPWHLWKERRQERWLGRSPSLQCSPESVSQAKGSPRATNACRRGLGLGGNLRALVPLPCRLTGWELTWGAWLGINIAMDPKMLQLSAKHTSRHSFSWRKVWIMHLHDNNNCPVFSQWYWGISYIIDIKPLLVAIKN